jgi:hypothetical protein
MLDVFGGTPNTAGETPALPKLRHHPLFVRADFRDALTSWKVGLAGARPSRFIVAAGSLPPARAD